MTEQEFDIHDRSTVSLFCHLCSSFDDAKNQTAVLMKSNLWKLQFESERQWQDSKENQQPGSNWLN